MNRAMLSIIAIQDLDLAINTLKSNHPNFFDTIELPTFLSIVGDLVNFDTWGYDRRINDLQQLVVALTAFQCNLSVDDITIGHVVNQFGFGFDAIDAVVEDYVALVETDIMPSLTHITDIQQIVGVQGKLLLFC